MKKVNPIAEQSKKWLIQALFELMTKKPYSDIKITEIADKAQLSRRTFYRNFKAKEDLLKVYFDYLLAEYIKHLKEIKTPNYDTLLITYFNFWNDHIQELRLLKRNHLFYIILELQNVIIPELTSIDFPWHNYSTNSEENYIGLFNIGGLWNVLSLWIENDNRESPEEMSKVIQKNIINFSKVL